MFAFECPCAGYYTMIKSINHRPSINGFQGCNQGFIAFQYSLANLPLVASHQLGLSALLAADVGDNQFFGVTTISTSFAARVIYFAIGLARRPATVGIILSNVLTLTPTPPSAASTHCYCLLATFVSISSKLPSVASTGSIFKRM
jgi:hypothetical protein